MNGHWITYRWIMPADNRPGFLQRLFPIKGPSGNDSIYIYFDQYKAESQDRGQYRTKVYTGTGPPPYSGNQKNSKIAFEVVHLDGKMTVSLQYYRVDHQAFNRTYRQICNSLRID